MVKSPQLSYSELSEDSTRSEERRTVTKPLSQTQPRAPYSQSPQNVSHSSRPRVIPRRHHRDESHELSINRDVTRDSMVESMLFSLNSMPTPQPQNLPVHPDYRNRRQPRNSPYMNPRAGIPVGAYPNSPASDYDLHTEDYFTADDQESPITANDEFSTPRQMSPRTSGEFAKAPNSSPQTLEEARASRSSREHKVSEDLSRRGSDSTVALDSNLPHDAGKSRPETVSTHTSSVELDRQQEKLEEDLFLQDEEEQPAFSIMDRSRPLRSEYHNFDTEPPPYIPSPRRNVSPPSTAQRFERSGLSTIKAPGLVTLRSANALPLQPPETQMADSAAIFSEPKSSNTATAYESPVGRLVTGDVSNKADARVASGSSKEATQKTGFFKRMFGSKQPSSSSLVPADTVPQLPPLSMDFKEETKDSKMSLRSNETQTSLKKVPKPPPEPIEIMPEPPQVLHKKSSFFRRKKKHSGDKDKFPSEAITGTGKGDKSLPSPSVSSLRKVMNPFLDTEPSRDASGLASPEAEFFDSREEQPARGRSDAGTSSDNIYSFGAGVKAEHKDAERPPWQAQAESSSSSNRPETKLSASSSQLEPMAKKNLWLSTASGHDSGRVSQSSGRKGSVATQSITTPITPTTGGLSESGESPRPRTSTNSPRSGKMPLRQMTNESQTSVSDTSSRYGSTKQQRKTPSPMPAGQENTKPLRDEDNGFVLSTQPRGGLTPDTSGAKSNRIFLRPTPSEEEIQTQGSSLKSPARSTGPSVSPEPRRPSETPSAYSASLASQTIPLVHVEGEPTQTSSDLERPASPNDPRESDMAQAKQLFDEHNEPQVQEQTNALLGAANESGERLRRAYFSHFDFAGLNILLALRDLCTRLALKGETQQLDRILSSFAKRWCECNPNHGFKSPDVVYSIIFSLFMLNTDLHIAEMDRKLSRPQFVKNTLVTIHYNLDKDTGDQEATIRAKRASARGAIPFRDMRSPSPGDENRPSLDVRSNNESRMSTRERPISEIGPLTSPTPYGFRPTDPSQLLVNAPFDGTMRGWEAQIETILKEYFNSIRQLRLPLHSASESKLQEMPSTASLSVKSMNTQRSGSVLVKDNMRGRSAPDFRNPGSRFSSKSRSRAKFYQNSTFNSSRATSRTSLEDSAWSPNASSTWSRSVFGKANSMMSTDSLGSQFTTGGFGFSESIGFAGALSNAIIREESTPHLDEGEGNLEVEDELLTMAGAPWAKEGLVHHKHHLDVNAKKAKDRHWSECFAVIEKGRFRLFSFSSKASLRQQKKALQSGGVVGGGNWTENAEELAQFLLRQTFANVLPVPGYSKSRPHVFALSLPTGAVHLFSVGTSQIASEFASTANYWSARLSKEPLVGGVSNVEYGWSENVINTALLNQAKDASRPGSVLHTHTRTQSSLSTARPSLTGSLRSSAEMSGVVKAKMPADRIALSDWSPPQQSLMASNLSEIQQLDSLRQYVNEIQDEHAKHQELRGPMMLAFSPRHPNQTKALSNWEKKSKYLLHEIVKFSNYIDCLNTAQDKKDKIFKEREERLREDAIARGEVPTADDDDDDQFASPPLPEEGINAVHMFANAVH